MQKYTLVLLLAALAVTRGCSSKSAVVPDSAAIDITNVTLTAMNTDCADYANSYTSSVLDVNRNIGFHGDITITVTDNHCVVRTNAIPNHDFNDGLSSFVNPTSSQADSYNIPRTPTFRSAPLALSLRVDNAIFLNGVKLDLLAAGCFGVGDGKIGCLASILVSAVGAV